LLKRRVISWRIYREGRVVLKTFSWMHSSWTARPDGSGWWDNRMGAQYLPRDLVRPSSGYEEL